MFMSRCYIATDPTLKIEPEPKPIRRTPVGMSYSTIFFTLAGTTGTGKLA